ncbi:MAG: radical SAM protein, partial [bacterium]|nr:radical SAM protein [bacterium]
VDVPDFSDFNANSYPCMASYVSRSCPFQCSFCSETVQWGKYRRKPAGQVATELWKLYETHGTQLFLMGDSLLNPVVKELSQVLYDQGKVIYWDGYLRADRPVCDPENTFQWRRGGFYRARLGVESGSENILKAMGKGIGPGQIKEAVSSLASAGIKTTTYWVIGHPGETEEDFQQTLDLLADLKDDIYEADCNPFNFYYSGQVLSEQWKKKSRLLYSQCASEMLVARTWTLDLDPRREVIYERISRFMAQCRALGIPNPYTLKDIYEADQRWLRLQKNAVPPVSEFGKGYMEECRQVQKLLESSTIDHDDDWGF